MILTAVNPKKGILIASHNSYQVDRTLQKVWVCRR